VSFLFSLGRVAEEFVLDQYSCVQSSRQKFLRSRGRAGLLSGRRGDVAGAHPRDALGASTASFRPVGGPGGAGNVTGDAPVNVRQLPRVLPSSVAGSLAYQKRLIDDGMAILRKHGAPTYFITMTCNPRWPEVLEATRTICGERAAGPGRSPPQHIINRVFKQKADLLLDDLRQGLTFGSPALYLMWVFEFQVRMMMART
jgi:hypothetical protein